MSRWMQDWSDGIPVVVLLAFCVGIVAVGGAAVWYVAYDLIGLGPKTCMLLGGIIPVVVFPVLTHRALSSWYRARAFEKLVEEKEAERLAATRPATHT